MSKFTIVVWVSLRSLLDESVFVVLYALRDINKNIDYKNKRKKETKRPYTEQKLLLMNHFITVTSLPHFLTQILGLYREYPHVQTSYRAIEYCTLVRRDLCVRSRLSHIGSVSRRKPNRRL